MCVCISICTWILHIDTYMTVDYSKCMYICVCKYMYFLFKKKIL